MKTLLLTLATFCAIWFAPAAAPAILEEPDFRIVGLEDKPALHDSVRAMALEGRETIISNTTTPWPGMVVIVWADEDLFREKTGFQPENSAAAASASLMTVWLNRDAWTRTDAREQQRTMTHELAHIVLGRLPGGAGLPLWANEGIVMHLAGQWSFDEHTKLLVAHLFGQLPQLSEMQETFPRDGESQLLAYRMSYSAVDVVAASYGDAPGRVGRLVRRLEDPDYGPYLARELKDPYRVEGWQLATEAALGSKLSTSAIVMTGTGSIFLLIAVLFLVAYAVVRSRRAARDRAYVQEQEPWENSLTEADIQDIYGDKDERWDEEE